MSKVLRTQFRARACPAGSGIVLVTAGLLGLGLAACSSPRATDELRRETLQAVQNQSLAEAEIHVNELYDSRQAGDLEEIDDDDRAEDTDISAKHGLLWRMQRGAIDQLAQDFTASNAHLQAAAALVDEYRAKAVSGIIGSATLNETAKSYDGKGFEHIQVDYLRALNSVLLAQQSAGLLPTPRFFTTAAGATPTADARTLYGQAISFARRAVLDQLIEVRDNERMLIGDYRFADDPFARVFAAALVHASSERTEGDLQFADAMITQALDSYQSQQRSLAGDPAFRFETASQPDLLLKLLVRTKQLYDPAGCQAQLARFPQLGTDPLARYGIKPGQGSILVLHHDGFVARPQVLDLRLRTGVGVVAGLFSLSDADRARGITISQITLGAVQVMARGPGSRIINHWTPGIFGYELVEKMRIANKIIGFAIPVHAPDRPIGTTASASVDGGPPYRLQVVSDVDAYARATLKDEQPRLITRALVRVLVKQLGVVGTEAIVEREMQGPARDLVKFVVGLGGSAIATASEVADQRAWWLLHDHVEAELIDVTAGDHHLSLHSSAGRRDLGQVTVPAGRLVIVPVRSVPAPTTPVP